MNKPPFNVTFSLLLGNMFEFYNFSLFGVFSLCISKNFFPHYSQYSSVVLSLLFFSISFFVRPLGGLIFGYYGDMLGRKKALLPSILGMGISTFMIGVLPTYETVGIISIILLLLLRLSQGFFLGGEANGVSIFLIEYVPQKKKGFYGSLVPLAGALGSLLAYFFNFIILLYENNNLWRLPFFFGFICCAISFYLRRNIQDSPEFVRYKSELKNPLQQQNVPLKNLFLIFIIGGLNGALIYNLIIYLNLHFNLVGLQPQVAIFLNIFSILIFSFLLPFFGWFSDKFGLKTTLKLACITIFLVVYPIFILLNSSNISLIAIGVFCISLITSFFIAPTNAFFNELIPISSRYKSISLSFSLGVALIGGIMPFISEIISSKDYLNFPAFYLAIISMSCYLFLRNSKSPLF